MLIFSLVLIGIVAVVSLIAGAIAAIFCLTTKSNALSLASGTLVIPVLICVLLGYWVMTMEADDPAPGNVLIGSFVALAVVTAIAWLASHLTIAFLSSRALRNGS
jgi:hypothetical protein